MKTLLNDIRSLKLDGPRWRNNSRVLPLAEEAFRWWDSEKIKDDTLGELAADWVLNSNAAKAETRQLAARNFLRAVARYLGEKAGAR